MTVLASNQVEMTPWSERALGSEQGNESFLTCRLLDFLDVATSLEGILFPSPTHPVYFALPRFKSLFVLASEASRSLPGSSAPLYLCNKGLYKGGEGLEVITVPNPTTAACAVLSLDAHLLPACLSDASKHWQEGGLMPQPT